MDYKLMQSVPTSSGLGSQAVPHQERRTAMLELDLLSKMHSELGAAIEALISRAAPAICIEPVGTAKAPTPEAPDPVRSPLCQEIYRQWGQVAAMTRLVNEAYTAMEL